MHLDVVDLRNFYTRPLGSVVRRFLGHRVRSRWRRVDGMTKSESDALLGMFHLHCQRPEYQVRYRWQPDTIGMWDNRCTQHKVVADNLDAPRKMERITLQGEAPR